MPLYPAIKAKRENSNRRTRTTRGMIKSTRTPKSTPYSAPGKVIFKQINIFTDKVKREVGFSYRGRRRWLIAPFESLTNPIGFSPLRPRSLSSYRKDDSSRAFMSENMKEILETAIWRHVEAKFIDANIRLIAWHDNQTCVCITAVFRKSNISTDSLSHLLFTLKWVPWTRSIFSIFHDFPIFRLTCISVCVWFQETYKCTSVRTNRNWFCRPVSNIFIRLVLCLTLSVFSQINTSLINFLSGDSSWHT